MNNAQQGFTPSEIVALFPACKPTVKKLIKEREAFLEEMRVERAEMKENIHSKFTTFDISNLDERANSIFGCGFAEGIIEMHMAVKYRMDVPSAESNLRDLKKIWHAFEPKGAVIAGQTARITDADLERARAYPIHDLLKVSRAHKTLCVWHDEKTASLHVYADNHVFCYSCQRRGDSIDVYMAVNHVTFVEAVRALI